MENKVMRIGIFGTLRGASYVDIFQKLEGAKVTAVCDNNPHSIALVKNFIKEDVQIFTDFDEFIDSGLMDAVMLCNYFYEHVPFAIKAMERGIHVLSECTPALTMAECVELCRAVERTGCKYMLAENYPFFACNMEMKRRYDTGSFGRAVFCEGEYNHPVSVHDKNMLAPGRNHWRNWLPRCYYLTHALAPLLYITGNNLKAVNCKQVFAPDTLRGTANRVGDILAIMLCEMEDGSLARVTGCAAWGGHGNWYRICAEKGNMENVRGTLEQVRVQYNSWQIPEGEQEVGTYPARWYEEEELNSLPGNAGHGGGDYWVAYHFTKYVNEGEHEAGVLDFDYAVLDDSLIDDATRGELVLTKGFFIYPSQLFANVLKRADKDENLNETLESTFNAIENSAQGTSSEDDLAGLFDDFDVNSNKLGATVAKRNDKLTKLLNGVADMNLGDVKDHDIDAFGDAYEYLMTMYASNAGKSGGEFFTPADVSELLTMLGTVGRTEVNKVYESKTPYLIQFNDCPLMGVA
jgi:type I restriction enzyme M protein